MEFVYTLKSDGKEMINPKHDIDLSMLNRANGSIDFYMEFDIDEKQFDTNDSITEQALRFAKDFLYGYKYRLKANPSEQVETFESADLYLVEDYKKALQIFV